MENDVTIDGKRAGLPLIMKRLNFVEDVGHYTRRFTRIYVRDNAVHIGHTINTTKTRIELVDMESWIGYFDRI